MRKTKIIFSIFTLIIIYFILCMFSKVEARYVKTASVDIDYNTSDYYFDIEVDKTEITSLPATINVTVRNYEGENFTDTDLQYTLSASNSNLNISIAENTEGILKGGSKQEKNFTINIDTKTNYANEILKLQFNILKPYTITEEIPIDINYRGDNIKVELANGMTPVKYIEGTGWVKTTEDDRDWYNYAEKQWANVVLGDSRFETKGSYQVLNEDMPYSMLVYIPRYAYKITSGWHSNQTGNIEVAFVDKNNTDRKGKKYNGTYEQAINGISSGEGMNNFVQHPAFTYGNTELNGIWVGKFETSHTNCTTNTATGQAEYTGNEVIMIKAGVTSWRNLTVSNAFDSCLKMNNNSIYGLSSDDNKVDPHLMKNTEWGAVTYLSKSKYGKENEEIWKNNNSYYITGQAGNQTISGQSTVTNNYDTLEGVKASTTGNITGVYDISGGAWELVSAYMEIDNNDIETGRSLFEAQDKYVDRYEIGTNNDQQSNYEKSYNRYGDAMYEISNYGTSNTSWFNDGSQYFYDPLQFMHRGARMISGEDCGPYFFGYSMGGGSSESFRLTISVI